MELEGLVLQPLACSLPSVGQQVLQWVLVQLPVELEGLLPPPLVLEWVLVLLLVVVVQLPAELEWLLFQPLVLEWVLVQ